MKNYLLAIQEVLKRHELCPPSKLNVDSGYCNTTISSQLEIKNSNNLLP